MIPIIEYSLFQRFSLDEAANKRPRGVLPMMAYRGRLCPKGVSFSRKIVYEKGKGLDPGAEPPCKNICWVPSPPGKRQGKMADYTRSQWKVWWSNTNTETLIWRALILQWWERTLANLTNVTLLQILASTPYVGWLCYWFSPLLWEVFRLQVLRFSPLLKNQQSQIRSGIHGHIFKSSEEKSTVISASLAKKLHAMITEQQR